jgi:hypothetical protein
MVRQWCRCADSGQRLGSVNDNLHGCLQSGWVSNLTLLERRSLSTPMGSLLIDRQDNGMVGRIDVEADDLVQSTRRGWILAVRSRGFPALETPCSCSNNPSAHRSP